MENDSWSFVDGLQRLVRHSRKSTADSFSPLCSFWITNPTSLRACVAAADGAVVHTDVDTAVDADDGADPSTTSEDEGPAVGGAGAGAAKNFEMDSCLKRLRAGEDDIG